jgi:O-antigen/teichoic acid export membrane protein
MAALIRPLAFALLVQGALLILAYHETVPIWLCGIYFEAIALIICAVVARQYGRGVLEATAEHGASLPIFKLAALRRVFQRIAPLGNVALVGVAYTRVDALAVSLVASGALLTQYLVYQRLASAPLMFFSTIASVSIAKFSGRVFGAEDLSEGIAPIRKHAYMAALVSGVALAVCSPVIASFFSIKGMNLTLLGLQCLVLTLQISNGFHAAFLVALHESSRLWVIARNNTLLAALIMPLAAWRLQAVGIALALCVVEAFCAAQYFRLFHENRFIKSDHAK